MGWTRSPEIKAQVLKLWERGELLRSLVSDEQMFPKRLKFSSPSSSEISQQFDAVRSWITEIGAVPHCRIVWKEYKHRVFGKNELPVEAWVDSADQAFAMIGKRKEAARFCEILNLTNERQPLLVSWLQRRPLQALVLYDDWERLLSIVTWLQANTRPAVYLRQVDIKDIHSKFIESHLSTLSELLDLALPEESISRDATGISQFARRYGFLSKPSFVRFRILDPERQLLAAGTIPDMSLDSKSFAQLNPEVTNVYFTENEVNYLAFPQLKESMVIFGSGYGFERLENADWLLNRKVFYWGDIDTHGFSILSSARKRFPHIGSFLMDEDTLLRHRAAWGVEPAQFAADQLPHLTVDEQMVYLNLKEQHWQKNLRLEQERISWRHALDAIHKTMRE